MNGDLEPEWSALDLFGEEDYAEGGGASPFLGVHRSSGKIFGLDVERDSSEMFLLKFGCRPIYQDIPAPRLRAS